jgi:HlyD family secretion protein
VNIAVAERKDVLLVPNAALRFKPANTDTKKSAVNPKNEAQKSSGRPDGSANYGGGKPKRDEFSGKVYVQSAAELKPITVTLGITDNRNTEIVSGELKVGDQVVLGEAQSTTKPKTGGTTPPRMF